VGVLVEEQLAVEDQEMESIDSFGGLIHMLYRKLKYLHNFNGHM
jgi:hypothetical protein